MNSACDSGLKILFDIPGVLQHDEQAGLWAVELALDAGPTKTHILNLLHRLIDGKAAIPEKIDAPPPTLTLLEEPKGLPLACTRSTQKPFSSL